MFTDPDKCTPRDPEYASEVLEGLEQVYEDSAVVGALTYYDTGLDALISRDRHRTIVLIDLKGTLSEKVAELPQIEKLLREIYPGVEISGPIPAEALAQSIAERDVGQAERFALPLALLLTLWFFRSGIAASLPIAVGAFAMAVSVAMIRLLANFFPISVFSLNVSAFLGLGLSIDYALLTVQRFREELPRSRSAAEAVSRALDTAGRAVFVSGLTVMVSMGVLFVVPLSLVRSVALGGILAVADALLGALVLLPALLAWIGARVNRLAIGRGSGPAGPSRAWAEVGEFANRHPWWTAGACILALVFAAVPALHMRGAMPDAKTFPRGTEVRTVDERIADPAQFDAGGSSELQIALETDGPVLAPNTLRSVQSYLAALAEVPGIAKVDTALADLDPDQVGGDGLVTTSDPDLLTELGRTVDGDLTLIHAQGAPAFRTQAAAQLVEAVRALPHPGRRLAVIGLAAAQVDVNQTLKRYVLLIVMGVVAWNLAVLFAAFRSVLVPLKAAVMNALSLAASFGALVWVFQDGHLAALLHFEPPNGIEPTIPLMLAAIVFGLSMDYEVFLLSRIQEEYRQHGDNQRSIVAGLAHTGRVISSAALILLVVIGAFAAGELVFIKEIGVGMSAAIALDVTIVRALLVPATMRLLGRWNWWAPRWLGAGLTGPPPTASTGASPS